MKRSPFQIILGILAVLTVLGGQFITGGALYGYSFMGIAGGITAVLKEIIEPSASGAGVLAMVGALLVIATMILLYGSLVLSFVLSIVLTFRFSASLAKFLSFLFGGVAIATAAGLISFSWLASRPDFRGDVHLENYFLIWPALFGCMAILYSRVNPSAKEPII